MSILILLLSSFLSVSNPDIEKLSSYECGLDPYEDARNFFYVSFYLVAILFIVFDLEAVFIYPWCVSLSFLSIDFFGGMVDFTFDLLLGFLYARKVGALN